MDWQTFSSLELLRFGDQAISLGALVAAALVLFAAGAGSWALRGVFERLRERAAQGAASTIYVFGQVTRYLFIFFGVVMAGSALGLDLSSLSLFAGAIGVGVGLGLQDIVRNFFSGVVLLFDRSIEVGDFVELGAGVNGEVAAIGPRATTIITNDNVDILVPNGVLLSGQLTNWTRNRVTRRVHVPFHVAFGSDKEKVRQAALDAARAVSFTLPDEGARRTQVWLVGFGPSALQFELVVWPTLEAVKRPGAMMAAYCWAIDDALRAHGIEIPFPQQEIRMRALFGQEGAAGLSAMHGRMPPQPRAVARNVPTESVNDAARDVEE